jgi:hypothetical protein
MISTDDISRLSPGDYEISLCNIYILLSCHDAHGMKSVRIVEHPKCKDRCIPFRNHHHWQCHMGNRCIKGRLTGFSKNTITSCDPGFTEPIFVTRNYNIFLGRE